MYKARKNKLLGSRGSVALKGKGRNKHTGEFGWLETYKQIFAAFPASWFTRVQIGWKEGWKAEKKKVFSEIPELIGQSGFFFF